MSALRATAGRLAVGVALPLAVASALVTAPAARAETTYTLAEVGQHATASDCWSAVNGGVYNLTAWIPLHPGGSSVIRAMCGLDGTASYNAQHSRVTGAGAVAVSSEAEDEDAEDGEDGEDGSGEGGGGGGGSAAADALARYRIGALAGGAPAPSVTYSMADVAAHSTAGDCWSAVSGGVYNLTTWIPQHPGGTGVVVAMCGVDGTATFVGKHSGSPGANSALAQFRIGTLGSSSTAPGANGSFTMAEVATHNTGGDCWSAVGGGVYNLTSWVSQHPGGAGVITAMCGVDASASFQGKHSGSPGANSALALLRIGTLIASTTTVVQGTYTLAEVAAHSTAGDCWSAVGDGVYSLTAWIPQHPGGQSAITAMCGVDATGSFVGKHANSSGANAALAQYRIGTLVRSATPVAVATEPTSTTTTTAPTSVAKRFTLKQVSRHDTGRNCWTAVNRHVYDLTPWTRAHPGRKAFVSRMCGRNATKSFNAGHGGAVRASRILQRYQIGVLASVAAAPVPSTAPAATTITMAEVASRATAASCWSAVNGSVYDLTEWITRHPGGQGVIKAMCGVDGTASFQGMHASSASAKSALAKLRIGTLG